MATERRAALYGQYETRHRAAGESTLNFFPPVPREAMPGRTWTASAPRRVGEAPRKLWR